MKTNLLFIIFLLLFISNIQCQDKNILITKLYQDTIETDTFYRNQIITYIDSVKYNSSSKFPNRKFTKVICYTLNNSYFQNEKSKIITSVFDKKNQKLNNYDSKVLLSQKEVKILLSIINDPLSYQWGACGTPIPKIGFVFYNKQDVIGYFDIGCSYNQINSMYPDFYITREGSLTNDARNKIINLVKKIGVKVLQDNNVQSQ